MGAVTWQELIDLLQRMIPEQLNKPVVFDLNNVKHLLINGNVIVASSEKVMLPYLMIETEEMNDEN
jgi:hypothetical protein